MNSNIPNSDQINESPNTSQNLSNESNDNAWFADLSQTNLEKLEECFKKNHSLDDSDKGLSQDDFVKAFTTIFEKSDLNAKTLFKAVNKEEKLTISWNDFLDFLIEQMCFETKNRLTLGLRSIEPVAHTKIESIAKIVLIETEQYFSYAIILKHGRVGLYDGNLNFLTSYHSIMTREDLSRPEDERKRRNRWVTDAVFCPDTLMLIITNTARSIVIYEASGLNHVPYWLILSTPNIIECICYEPFIKCNYNGNSFLFSGDCKGEIMSFEFLQPKNGLLRRKRQDQLTLFYWNDFLKETDYVVVKNYGKVHQDCVKQIQFVEKLGLLLTCSKDPNASIAIKHIDNKKKTAFYKVTKGVNCFAFSTSSKLLVTGSANGVVRLWNTFISKIIGTFSKHRSAIVDVQIMDNQDIFISCDFDGILNLWDIKEHACLQTIKVSFPPFRIHGKFIEWSVNCIYPGPRRQRPNDSLPDTKKECFGICDINEKSEYEADTKRSDNRWDRSNILITCCNYIAILQANFADASIEYGFTYPILPPPPLQNSVLIPSNWGLQSDTSMVNNSEKQLNLNVNNQMEQLKFILNKDLLEEIEGKSDINYKIAILESKKEMMHSKVALGSPYLALDLHEIPQLKLPDNLPINNVKKSERYFEKITKLLNNAAHKNEVFSSPEASSGRSKSSRSSIVELPY